MEFQSDKTKKKSIVDIVKQNVKQFASVVEPLGPVKTVMKYVMGLGNNPKDGSGVMGLRKLKTNSNVPRDISQAVENAVDFQSKWTNSVQGKKLLNESGYAPYPWKRGTNDRTPEEILEFRNKRLGNVEVQVQDDPSIFGSQSTKVDPRGVSTTLIKMRDKFPDKTQLNSTAVHEASHSGDTYIPNSDLNLMRNSQIDGFQNTDNYDYYSNSGEVRSSLNEDRKHLLDKGVDVFNKPVTIEDLKLLEDKRNTSSSYYPKKRKLYGDDGWLKLLNTVSDTSDNNSKYKNIT